MSMTGKHKAETTLERAALADWLRGLAQAIEAGELPGDTPVSLEGWRGLKISVKPGFGETVRAKLSVKFPKPAGSALAASLPGEDRTDLGDDEDTGALPKYKSLKKHMKQTFKAIGQALAAGQMPPALEAQSFIADSKLMVSYPGKGDEFYAAYLEKTQAFEAALAAADLEALQALYRDLAQLKRDCHSRHA